MICIVFICNKLYLEKFIETCSQLINIGKYKGDICLVVGNDLKEEIYTNSFILKNNIIIKYFPDIIFSKKFFEYNNNIKTDGRNITKRFQWHKLYLFHKFFKKWDYIFFLDCNMNIYRNISPIINLKEKNTLLAHSDAYPNYMLKLNCQFDLETYSNIALKLKEKYNLNVDYFQTGILFYDTKLIKNNTFKELYKLALKYPISKTNEQGIMNLYFNCKEKVWKQIPIKNKDLYFYDYWSRDPNKTNYIITKIKIGNKNMYYYTFCVDIGRIDRKYLLKGLYFLLKSFKKYIKDFYLVIYSNFLKPNKYKNIEIKKYYNNISEKIYDCNWKNLSLNKLFIFKDLFNEFNKNFIWVDLDTIITGDINYLNDLDNFFIFTGGNSNQKQYLIKGNKNVYVEFKNYIQGNFWKINIDIYNKIIDLLEISIKKKITFVFDLQDLFNYYHYFINNKEFNIIGMNIFLNKNYGTSIWSKEGNIFANVEGLKNLFRKNNKLYSKYYPEKEIDILSFTFYTLIETYRTKEFKNIV